MTMEEILSASGRDPERYYTGHVLAPLEQHVTVTAHGKTKRLPWRLEVWHHSPTGLSWGYHGSGPAQCALAILCDVIGPRRAVRLHQQFKRHCIAPLAIDEGWSMTAREVLLWVAFAEHEDCTIPNEATEDLPKAWPARVAGVVCQRCGAPFVARRCDAKYCSAACRMAAVLGRRKAARRAGQGAQSGDSGGDSEPPSRATS